jgi:hypothetical protein
MGVESWRVRNSRGEDLGSIKKFIIDSNTRQISYIDVVLMRTNQLVRVPWNICEVINDAIWLKASADLLPPALQMMDGRITLEVNSGLGNGRHRNAS